MEEKVINESSSKNVVKQEFVIQASSTMTHRSASDNKASQGTVKQTLENFVNRLRKQNGCESNWNQENELVLDKANALDLHFLTTEMERLGRMVTITKTMTIKISE